MSLVNRRSVLISAVSKGSLLFLMTGGCASGRLKPVNVELARSTLETVLEHWKEGGEIEDLRNHQPEIVAQESLWSRGHKLTSYQLMDEGRAEDANWYCEVELILEPPGSTATMTKKVTYVVGTHPVLTVFHALL